MRNWLLAVLALAVAAGLGTGVAAGAGPAQEPLDPTADKTAATVDLQAGYVLDPYLLPVIGSGKQEAASVHDGCTGYIDATPDVTVNWSGSAERLSFFVYSDDDPVLLVEQPDGSVVCNDDAGLGTVQPLVAIANPEEGTYRLFVGSADQARPALGMLGITQAKLDAPALAGLDLSPMLRRKPQAAPAAQFDASRLPNVLPAGGRGATLEPGFQTLTVLAVGGGDLAATQIEDSTLKCAGFANPVASYRFAWRGASTPLRLFFDVQVPSSLFVVGPDKTVLCDTGTAESPSPIVDIAAVKEGEYRVYVAGLQPDRLVAGKLTMTEDMHAAPAAAAGQGH